MTSREILVFEVSKQLSWYKYCYHTKLSRFGLGCLITLGGLLGSSVQIIEILTDYNYSFHWHPSGDSLIWKSVCNISQYKGGS